MCTTKIGVKNAYAQLSRQARNDQTHSFRACRESAADHINELTYIKSIIR